MRFEAKARATTEFNVVADRDPLWIGTARKDEKGVDSADPGRIQDTDRQVISRGGRCPRTRRVGKRQWVQHQCCARTRYSGDLATRRDPGKPDDGTGCAESPSSHFTGSSRDRATLVRRETERCSRCSTPSVIWSVRPPRRWPGRYCVRHGRAPLGRPLSAISSR